MTIYEATIERTMQICREKRLSEYSLIELSGMPPSTMKCILHGRTRNPGIANVNKLAEGLGMSIREFFDSELFDNLDQGE